MVDESKLECEVVCGDAVNVVNVECEVCGNDSVNVVNVMECEVVCDNAEVNAVNVLDKDTVEKRCYCENAGEEEADVQEKGHEVYMNEGLDVTEV